MPERDLANLFNVSRTTAINAYRMLERQDLVRTKVGSGTFVADSNAPITEEGIPWLQLFKSHSQSSASDVLREMVSDSPFRDVISFVTGMPDPAFYPVETFKGLFNKYVDSFNKADLGYISSEGYEPLRRSVSEMLKAEGIPSQAEEIMIVSGAQQGLYLLSKALLELSADPQLIKRLAFDKQYVDLNTNIITQWLLQIYLEEGNLKNHLAFVRGQYKKRRNEMAKALNRFCENEIDFAVPEGGYYFWCRIRGGGTTGKLLHESIKNGVSFAPGDAFYNSPGKSKEFRLCFVTHDERTIVEGVRRLGKTLGVLRKTKRDIHNSAVAGPPII